MKKLAHITVLVVDDEQGDRSLVANTLTARGHAVLEAVNYTDAMAIFDRHRNEIAMLISDVALPDGLRDINVGDSGGQ